MIEHLVLVRLRHPSGSAEEAAFLEDCQMLAGIPGVQSFQRLRQIHPDSRYRLAFAMRFADQDAYDTYKVHPDHVAFVENVWTPSVEAGEDVDLVEI